MIWVRENVRGSRRAQLVVVHHCDGPGLCIYVKPKLETTILVSNIAIGCFNQKM